MDENFLSLYVDLHFPKRLFKSVQFLWKFLFSHPLDECQVNKKVFMWDVFDQILLTGHELFLKTNELSSTNGIQTHKYLDRK